MDTRPSLYSGHHRPSLAARAKVDRHLKRQPTFRARKTAGDRAERRAGYESRASGDDRLAWRRSSGAAERLLRRDLGGGCSETGLDEPLREVDTNLDAVDGVDRTIADLGLRDTK
jgi:hypothetical protein